MTYQRDMKNQIKKIMNHIDNRTAFTKQPRMVPIIRGQARDVVSKVKDFDGSRDQRLILEKEIKMVRVLTYKFTK